MSKTGKSGMEQGPAVFVAREIATLRESDSN